MKKIYLLLLACTLLLTINGSAATGSMPVCFNVGPYTISGQDPYWNRDNISNQQLTDQLNALKARDVMVIALYSAAGDSLKRLRQIAKSMGMFIICRCYLTGQSDNDTKELNALIDAAQNHEIDIAVIGGEPIRLGCTPGQVLSYISIFRQNVPRFPVCVSETYQNLVENPAIVEAGDAVLVNIYPFWEGVDILNAAPYLREKFLSFQAQFPDKFVILGETGWPTAGYSVGAAVPDPVYAAWYFWCVESWSKSEGVFVFYFEAFDEPWKVADEGSIGAHWGVWDSSYHLKYLMEYGLSDWILPAEYWSYPKPPVQEPSITFTYVPPIGSSNNLQGMTYNVSPDDYAIAVYIRVSGGWWTKPSFAYPITIINAGGGFVCDITTGGSDTQATDIAAFVIPKSYSPPALGGSGSLPNELYQNSVANLQVSR